MTETTVHENPTKNIRGRKLRPVESEWEWQLRGACRQTDSATFFAPAGEHRQDRRTRENEAKRLCAGCPVRRRCLEHALAVAEPYGVWGGLTETERRIRYARPA